MVWVELVGIVIAAMVAIVSIRRVADEARLSSVHSEMRGIIVKAVAVLGRVVELLDHVAGAVRYTSALTGQPIETAHRRFWREIDQSVKEYREITAELRLLLPEPLHHSLESLVVAINAAKNLAKDEPTSPNSNVELREAVDKAGACYREFINASRKYIKADELKPLRDWQLAALRAEVES